MSKSVEQPAVRLSLCLELRVDAVMSASESTPEKTAREGTDGRVTVLLDADAAIRVANLLTDAVDLAEGRDHP